MQNGVHQLQITHTFIFLGGRLRLIALSKSERITSASPSLISCQFDTRM